MRSSDEKFAIAAVAAWFGWALAVLAFNIAIIWVVVHFISKYW